MALSYLYNLPQQHRIEFESLGDVTNRAVQHRTGAVRLLQPCPRYPDISPMTRWVNRPVSALLLLGATASLTAVPLLVAPTPASAGGSAITTMWLWSNSVDPSVDPRGTGLASATPEQLTDFAVARGLHTVHVSAPWASDEGPVAAWLSDTVTSLDDAGIDVGVLGGDPGWIDAPQYAVQWMTAATYGRPVSHVRLDVEPWTLPAWQTDPEGVSQQWLDMLDSVGAAMPSGVDLSVDAPWWLTAIANPEGPGTLFDAVLQRVQQVGIVTFVDQAEGSYGIVALSQAAVDAAETAGVPYTIGLETETPQIAGGAQFTFYDEGAAALETEAAEAAGAFEQNAGFRGISVEHYASWRSLIERPTTSLLRSRTLAPTVSVLGDGLGLRGYSEQPAP